LGMQGLDEHTSIKRKAVFAAVIVLGFASRGILAHAEHADENLPPHQTPHTAEPPTGGHSNLGAGHDSCKISHFDPRASIQNS
jgi:hypothetical protein